MKVLVVAPAVPDTSPGQRFRIEQWAAHLRREGWTFTYEPFEDDELHRVLYQPGRKARKAALILKAFARRFRSLSRVRQFDVVYLFREGSLAGPPLFERLLAHTGVPVVYDFDDAVWVPYVSPANKYLSYLKCFGKTRTLCRISKHVMAGNEYLAEYARAFNSNVTVVPTTIDTDVYQPRSEPPADSCLVTIGWTGSHSTVQHLDTIRSALLKLRQRIPYRLTVIGTPHYHLDGVEVTAKAWSATSEVANLQQFDIGLMPLPDDDWSRGKCGLKLLQYMGVGVPVVGSPVGVNAGIIREGVNGYLAASEDEWVNKLTALARSADLRRTMGAAGRRVVECEYSAAVWVPRVREIFRRVARPHASGGVGLKPAHPSGDPDPAQ